MDISTDLLTTDEVALITRAPVSTVRYWRHLGTGPRSFRLGRRVVYRRHEVEQLVRQAIRQAVAVKVVGMANSSRTRCCPRPVRDQSALCRRPAETFVLTPQIAAEGSQPIVTAAPYSTRTPVTRRWIGREYLWARDNDDPRSMDI
jgi:hypothetical protein